MAMTSARVSPTMMPRDSNLALMSGELRALVVSADMRRTMSLGTPDGVRNRTQVEPSMAGPSRPQDRVTLGAVRGAFRDALGREPREVSGEQAAKSLRDGAVVVAPPPLLPHAAATRPMTKTAATAMRRPGC